MKKTKTNLTGGSSVNSILRVASRFALHRSQKYWLSPSRISSARYCLSDACSVVFCCMLCCQVSTSSRVLSQVPDSYRQRKLNLMERITLDRAFSAGFALRNVVQVSFKLLIVSPRFIR